MLAEKLAARYRTIWVPEYAREFLSDTGGKYKREDLVLILRGQLEKEKEALPKARRFLFCDTGPLVIKIWSEVKFGMADPEIEHAFHTHRYDLYLLTFPDLPWQPDPLRESRNKLPELFEIYKKTLSDARFPFRIVRGEGEDRLNNAIRIIEEYFTGRKPEN